MTKRVKEPERAEIDLITQKSTLVSTAKLLFLSPLRFTSNKPEDKGKYYISY